MAQVFFGPRYSGLASATAPVAHRLSRKDPTLPAKGRPAGASAAVLVLIPWGRLYLGALVLLRIAPF